MNSNSTDCFTPNLFAVDESINKMIDVISLKKSARKSKRVRLEKALNCILATDIISDLDVPPSDNSGMDGYALNASDLNESKTLKLVGSSFAGKPFQGKVSKGECIKIMTGAPLPEGTDSVLMQEQTQVNNGHITFLVDVPHGNSVRKRGENIAKGERVLDKGTRLNAAKLALLASLGKSEVTVYESLRVGVLTTGDELVEPGGDLKAGQIFEANRVMLVALLEQVGVDVTDFGIVADKKEDIYNVLSKADKQCDLVISSGGVSVGDADFVKDVLEEIGSVSFWKVAIKPGKPFAFGKLTNAWFCGLPGNPVSSYVTCQQLVLPLIIALNGENTPPIFEVEAIASANIKKQPGRKDYQRGILTKDTEGNLVAEPSGPQGSGIMTSVTKANCYIVLDRDSGNVNKGSPIKVLPFSQLPN